MRLLHTTTYALEEFIGDQIPKYAVLSHTWEAKEINFHDIQQRGIAGSHQFHVSVNKSNSGGDIHERSLHQFMVPPLKGVENEDPADVTKCRWFTRGWTLQELLAPPSIQFFDRTWKRRFSRMNQAAKISKVVNIPQSLLLRAEKWIVDRIFAILRETSVARRMSWAADRRTTRVEDKAYCLLGIFNISMPMLYGEGDKAFVRLQHEIMNAIGDCTLLAWGFRFSAATEPAQMQLGDLAYESQNSMVEPLATSPEQFRYVAELETCRVGAFKRSTFAPVQRGLGISLPVRQDPCYKHIAYGILGCKWSKTTTEPYRIIVLPLLKLPLDDLDEGEYLRTSWSRPIAVPPSFIIDSSWSTVTICSPSVISRKTLEWQKTVPNSRTVRIALACRESSHLGAEMNGIVVTRIYPADLRHSVVVLGGGSPHGLGWALGVEPMAPNWKRIAPSAWFEGMMDQEKKTVMVDMNIGSDRIMLFLDFVFEPFSASDHRTPSSQLKLRGYLLADRTEADDDFPYHQIWNVINGATTKWVDAALDNKMGFTSGIRVLTFILHDSESLTVGVLLTEGQLKISRMYI
ncbi:hypothetical protein QBC40DRAFT_330887 [Triangularia verruculosa]|uniref:DUF8212 domain-containing protein n=1 Tax=Triangularia verruculosa TaxID=2587418 RepID=A0AAN6XVN2_9PEZI|nr:hypothetical protein QBC40DRAFT_330887 [Triangularia verruculosa]